MEKKVGTTRKEKDAVFREQRKIKAKENQAILKERRSKKKSIELVSGVKVYIQRPPLVKRLAVVKDYLKYYRIVKYWAMKKYNLTLVELELIFFLHSEHLFMKTDMINFSKIYLDGWSEQKFHDLQVKGWISRWRKGVGREGDLYELTHIGKTMVNDFYNYLDGSMQIPETSRSCTIFDRATSGPTDKQYAKQLSMMNKTNKKLKVSTQDPVEKSALTFRQKS